MAVTPDVAAARYKGPLEALAALGEGTPETRKWNRLVDSNHAAYLVLRESDDGRLCIESLLDHEAPEVRAWAASHALLWNEPAARPVLEALEASRGLVAVGA